MPDPRDIFGPPEEPTECFCMHCGRIFMSDLMVPVDVDGERHWMCPVPGCGAMGFSFDIFPTDTNHPDSGWVEDEEFTDEELGITDDEPQFDVGESIAEQVAQSEGSFDPPTEWSPEADAEDAEEEPVFDDAFEDDSVIDRDAPPEITDRVTHPSRFFTRDDYDAAKASGAYEKAIEEEREFRRRARKEEQERQSRIARGETLPGDTFSEDDIPF